MGFCNSCGRPIVKADYGTNADGSLNDEYCTMESVLEDNAQVLELAQKYNVNYVLIDDEYKINIDLQ